MPVIESIKFPSDRIRCTALNSRNVLTALFVTSNKYNIGRVQLRQRLVIHINNASYLAVLVSFIKRKLIQFYRVQKIGKVAEITHNCKISDTNDCTLLRPAGIINKCV